MKNNLKRVFSLVLVFMLCITFIPMNTASAKTFKDVPKTHWAYSYIDEMSNKGYIHGITKDKFGYGTFVTVKQYQAILLRILDYSSEAKKWDMVSDYAVTYGLMDGLDLKPDDYLNRGEMALMTTNALNTPKKGSTLNLLKVLNLKK